MGIGGGAPRPFAGILFDCVAVPSPALGGHAAAFEAMQRAIAGAADTLAAVVVEPMVQGAAGMQMYSADYLRALRECCDRHDVLLIIDEVFAGYGRTGRMWASDHAGITADLMCIGKAFASILPMAATMTTERIFAAFRGDSSRAFYYGHTFCGHPIGAALAREVLRIYRDEDILGQVARKSERIARTVERLGQKPGVRRPRHLGMIGAVDLGEGGYLGETGVRFFKAARANGAYLRPMGDCVYICPPLNIADGDLDRLCDIFEASIDTALA